MTMKMRVRTACACYAGWLLTLHATVAVAQENASPPLTQGSDMVEVPGVGRVILVFLIVAALAVGAVFMLRRVLPRLPGGYAPDSRIRIVARAMPASGVRVHLLQVDEQRVLLAEQRGTLSMIVLPGKESPGP